MINFQRRFKKTRKCQDRVEPIPGIEMTKMGNGKYICARRGGDPFLKVKRPIYDGCPEGTSPCSNDTKPENVVCYPKEKHEKLCPITYLEFVKRR
jgi:hypothetical protein